MIRQLIESAIHQLTKRRRDPAGERDAALLAHARQLEAERRPSDAAGVYREILGRQPQHLAALSALGGLLCELNRHDEALRCYEAALALEPDDRALLFKLGNLQWLMGRLTDADETYRHILAIAPDDAHALNNLGLVRQEEGDSLEAERFFRAALQSDPDYIDARSNLLLCLNYQDRYPPERVYREHVSWAKEVISGIAPRALSYRGRPHDRIRVGYISPNLKTHSVAYFFEPLLLGITTQQGSRFSVTTTRTGPTP